MARDIVGDPFTRLSSFGFSQVQAVTWFPL
jgi:hypothetical protein